ncbi:hypothetical protein OCOL_000936 [Ordospora colligata]|uniref:Uncharacterized protein n=1 Tax=Ordospora colligata OC4 TaxID=1354746 RepID=A0A0B2ULC7_9MICR|nr:uncharacterized protein M896_040190 [Ordospora colligata OC4]KHN69827.1 hypothetical protein M896_040190 [Ordospora colligata OC4]TBU15997.1 hypothetical protein CWI41_040190 [Ordospora colligata]TBU16210.1 hypothetical protein CWI40_040190 [Ordospora colligata]
MEVTKNEREMEARSKGFGMYLRLKKMPQGVIIEDDIHTYFAKKLNSEGEVVDTLLGIIEILRISAPKCFLSKDEMNRFFGLLIKILPSEKINLENFIEYRMSSLLTDKGLIMKLVRLIGCVSGAAKQYLKEMIIVLIEEKPESIVKEIIKILLGHIARDESINSVIEATKEASMPIVEILMEGFDDKKYVDIYSSLTLNKSLCIRNIRGCNKVKYLKSAVCGQNFEKLFSIYGADRSKEVIMLLADNCSYINRDAFNRMINNNDENVRIKLLEKITFDDIALNGLEMHERVLDLSDCVRSRVFEVFNEGVCKYKECLINSICDCKRKPELEDIDGNSKCLLRFVEFILKGMFTGRKQEYVNVMIRAELPWKVYFQLCAFKGLHEFLELSNGKLKTNNEDFPINTEERRFYIKYFFCGSVPDCEIMKLIEVDVLSALEYLKYRNIHEYADILISKLITYRNRSSDVIVMIDDLKPYLYEKKWHLAPRSDTELLIYAHSKYVTQYIDYVQQQEVSFAMLYFLSCMKLPIDVLGPLVLNYKGSCEEHVEIQLAYNDRRMLKERIGYFMNSKLSESLKRRLLSSRSFVGSMIYFVNTGQVAIRNMEFFVWSIYLICMDCNNASKAREIYETYVMKVDIETFNKFYTVCSKLKNMSPRYADSDYAEKDLLTSSSQQMLQLICNTIISVRAGEIVEVHADLHMFYESAGSI